MNIATGELAAVPASREELEDLCGVLWERVRAAESERNALRAWADKMPKGIYEEYIPPVLLKWMRKRPDSAGK